MTIETQAIAVSMPDGHVRIMRIITHAPIECFSTESALANGFILSEDGEFWDGGITDAGIEMEVARAFGGAPVTSWRRIADSEIPGDRTFRNALVDKGKLEHDFAKAREQTKVRLSRERHPARDKIDTALSFDELKQLQVL